MVDQTAFHEPLSSLTEWATETGHSFALVGGLAVSSHAEPRTTRDVDVLVVTIEPLHTLLDSLRPFGFQEYFEESIEIANRGSVLVLRHTPSLVKVDMMIARLPLEEEFVGDAVVLELAGVSIPVITVEHLVIMKLLASRPQDEADLHALVQTNPDLDRTEVLRIATELATMIESPELVEQANRFLQNPEQSA